MYYYFLFSEMSSLEIPITSTRGPPSAFDWRIQEQKDRGGPPVQVKSLS